jgi:hypothetical protein
LFGTRGGLGPVDGHHVAEVAGDGPPHLALVHDLLLGTNLKSKVETFFLGTNEKSKVETFFLGTNEKSKVETFFFPFP